jgi:hypothetical protein
VTDTNLSLTTVKARIPFSFQFTVPTEVETTEISEAAAQMANLVASTLIKSCVSSGYAPT